MIADFLTVAVGMALLLGGGELLVRGAARLAGLLGVSPLAVGLTIVAFGTSAPELAVNLLAAMRGSGGLSFGNIVGSNLANIGLIFGLAAVFRPIPVQDVVVRREMPMMLLATAAAMAMAFDGQLSGRDTWFDRGDGFILLLFFVVFIYYTLGDFLRTAGPAVPADRAVETNAEGSVPWNFGLIVIGLLLLTFGAHLTVEGATALARGLGVPEVIIGLTLLALGTSLPELAATVMAVIRGHSAMAVGNVVGSNIFNLLLVGGLTALVEPIPIPPGANVDLGLLCALSVLLWVVSMSRGQKILRAEGGLLLGIYLVYLGVRSLG